MSRTQRMVHPAQLDGNTKPLTMAEETEKIYNYRKRPEVRTIVKKYRDAGLKLTPQRLAILDYLDGNSEHPSAEDIFRAVSRRFPTMSFATVYNTLEALGERGFVTEITIDPSKKRFDPDPAPHHHLVCVACKRIVDIKREFPVALTKGEQEEFDILGAHIEFYGLCPKCKKRVEA